MKKRIFSLFLAMILLFSLFPAVRAEEKAAQPELEAMIAEQFDAFVKKLKPGSSSDGPMQLVLHALTSSKALHMDQDDSMTGTFLNSRLLRATFVDAAAALCRSAGSVFGSEEIRMGGNLYWYQAQMGYRIGGKVTDDNSNPEDDPTHIPGFYLQDLNLSGNFNSFDEAMFLVVGDGRCFFTFEPRKITDTTVSYHVTISINDKFDFNNDEYYGDDQDLEKFLTWVGKMLAFGMLNTFDWSATAEFDLHIPNLCPHVSHNYAWEYDGTEDLAAVSSEEFTLNPLTRIDGSVDEDGVFQKVWYTTQVPMRLCHDRPWVLEFRCNGTGDFVLADCSSSWQGTFLRRNRNTIFFNTRKNITQNEKILESFGRNYTETTGFLPKEDHTYTLTNHVFPDGTSMVRLSVDGVDLGDMDRYYSDGVFVKNRPDWYEERDFIYGFIGNTHCPLKGVAVEYIRAWENGKENDPFSYLSTAFVFPTCTADGGTLNTCSLCGAEFLTEVIPATGHDFTDWQTVKDATCTAEGRMERSCKTCGHRESRPVAVLPHAYTPALTAPNCTDGGFTTYTCECGDSYVADHTDALGHDLTDWVVINDPTCTEDGLEERWCQRCEHREARIVDPLGHSYTATIVKPQCTVGGYTEYVCFCGDSYRTNFTNPTGHHYEGVVTEPGCTEMGYTTYTCACGDSYKSNFTAPVGHRYESVVTAPTCTDGGYTTYTCVCGDSYVSNYTNALGHEYAEGLCIRCGADDPNYQKPVENPFTDVPEDSFYFSPVLWAVENGITTGASETTFNPGGECMRAHVVTFLWRAAGSPEPSSNANPFVDVKESDFYYKAVLWSVENGITNGADATHFNPFGICNRAQVVTFLYRAFGSPAVESENNPFTDVPTVGWYTAPVLWAVRNGITNGLSADSFGPDSPCNRAQVVTFLHRAYT